MTGAALPRVWFITGASSGFGRSMTELVLRNGEIAVATLRKPEALADLSSRYSKDRLLILKVDVTVQADVEAAFKTCKNTLGRIDVVFNNAGFALLGEIETTPEDIARRVFEVNFWGALRVTKAAVQFFREVNGPTAGGRLLQVSSISGIQSKPVLGYYGATKHALEAISVSIAKELDPSWNIKVTLIEPGFFRTRIQGSGSSIVLPMDPAYYSSRVPAQTRQYLSKTKPAGDPEKAVEVMYRASMEADPPLHLPLGEDALSTFHDTIDSYTDTVEKYASWAVGLKFDDA